MELRERYLDESEVSLMNPCHVAAMAYRGHLDTSALDQAYRVLCTYYPVLSAHIRRDEQGYLLYLPTDQSAGLRILYGDEGTVEDVARRPWDNEREVAELVLVRSSEASGFVAHRTDHAVFDGNLNDEIRRKLWNIYTDLVNKKQVTVADGRTLPPSPRSFLKKSGKYDPIAYPSLQSDGREILHEIRQRRLCLSDVETSRLLAVARDEDVSVHGLITGVIAVAQRRLSDVTGPAPMYCISTIDLARRMDRKEDKRWAANALAMHRGILSVSTDSDPIDIGLDVRRQLKESLRTQDLIDMNVDHVLSLPVETTLASTVASFSVSNIGELSEYAVPVGLTITDLFRPNVVLQRREPKFPTYGAYTYGGKLHLMCRFSPVQYSSEEVSSVCEYIEAGFSALIS